MREGDPNVHISVPSCPKGPHRASHKPLTPRCFNRITAVGQVDVARHYLKSSRPQRPNQWYCSICIHSILLLWMLSLPFGCTHNFILAYVTRLKNRIIINQMEGTGQTVNTLEPILHIFMMLHTIRRSDGLHPRHYSYRYSSQIYRSTRTSRVRYQLDTILVL